MPVEGGFAEALRAERLAVEERVRRRESELGELAGARGDANSDDEHDPEGATLSDEWSRLTGLRAQERRELERIDAAAARLRDGTFGVCEGCGSKIPRERLRVRPTATRCVSCASSSRR
ncbi:TraR/DksA C4-type zinc finger protein [Microbacterium betulae]|uniref:TraR/DksA C4-type zinc finger protein n=1 Tax=Microbacterium betulae TaxID=2981139 RepID=A0AA97I5R2_9MICO|nr:TraR/DksA C4-type zinc finger protein [Microbacterium sp. AB]WOF21780.1 TraR/DksA C4-type zinc finger protein [Microbacterium sp. AB]